MAKQYQTGQYQTGDYGFGATALLIAGEPAGAQAGGQALAAIGARLVAQASVDQAVEALALHQTVDLVLIEAHGADPDELINVLSHLDRRDGGPSGAVVATLDFEQIDLVSTHLSHAGAQLLCAPTIAERASALAIALAQAGSGAVPHLVRERDKDAERLHRLNEEVARIAETLARLTRGEGTPARAMLGDGAAGYRAAPGSAVVEVTAPEVRQAIRLRRLRDQFFAEGLLEDPAWDMLLDLYAADLERAQVSVSSLCIAAAVPATTALRWIGRMTEEGLFERQPDPFDKRRAFMALSAVARDAMERYWAAARQSGAGPV